MSLCAWLKATLSFLRSSLLLVAVAVHPLGCGDSDGWADTTADGDRAAIEAALQRYAEALDWPRGTGWEERFSPIAPGTWPVDLWEGGYELFKSLFTDDAVLDYESLCMQIEADLPERAIVIVKQGDPACPVLGFRIRGSLDFFYYGITLGTQLESQTTVTPLTIEINGNTAISEDSYVHIAVLNHHLLGEPSPPTETQEGVHRAEWVKEADGWKIKHWGGIVEF